LSNDTITAWNLMCPHCGNRPGHYQLNADGTGRCIECGETVILPLPRYSEGTLDGTPRNGAMPPVLHDDLRVPFVVDVDGHEPTKAHGIDAGWDIRALRQTWLYTETVAQVLTGLRVNIPAGWYGQLLTRSSMARKGLIVVGGVIDAGYTGEIIVMIANVGTVTRLANAGDKIAQLVLLPVPRATWERVETLEPTERGAAGFGSTGV